MFTPRSRSPAPGAPSSNWTRRSILRSRSPQLIVFRFGWIVLVIWYEVGAFFGSLSNCRFPDAALRKSSGQAPKHVVLIADPHVPHPILSHPPDSRPWLNAFRQGMEELFMRKSWDVVTRLGRIDAVIFVGDMLDQGRAVMTDNEYQDYFGLFKSIFRLPTTVPMYYVPGNHDIPLGRTGNRFSSHARQRYIDHFSSPNSIVTIANHSIILLDSIGLVEEDYRRYYAEMQFGEWEGSEDGVIGFVQDLGRDPPPSPILISHIPLARTEAVKCGPLRESHEQIKKGVGHGYQNLLGRETSRFLLETLEPTIVFSGDDHDYCEVLHPNGVTEVTIKSFSSDAGVRRPGFQLLSLVPPKSDLPSLANVPCFLPDQLGVYTHVYLPLALLTLAYLIITNIRAAWLRSPADKRHILSDEKHRDRPLPSRHSSNQLQSITTTHRHHGSVTPNESAPSSPSLGYGQLDPELGNDDHSPALSRRSSYGGDLNNVGSYSTPKKSNSNLLPPVLQPTPRRVQLPRMLSASDWAAAARAKDMSVLSLVADRRKPLLARIKQLLRWFWRSRNSVLGKSWWELVSIALPAAVVWLIMNGLFWHR